MTTVDEAKAMARRLRSRLEARGQSVTHSESLELVAAQLGHRDWNTASALLEAGPASEAPAKPAAPEPLTQEGIVRQLHQIRARMMDQFEGTADLRTHEMLGRINNKIVEEERKLAAWRRAQEWQAVGLFGDGAAVPIRDPDILKKIDQWRRIDEVVLPHPEVPGLADRAGIYEVGAGSEAIRFAATPMGPGRYAIYVPRDDRGASG